MGVIDMMEEVFLGTTVKIGVFATGSPEIDVNDCDYDIYAWASPVNDRYQKMPSTGVVHRRNEECAEYDEICVAEVPTGDIGKGYIIVRIEIRVPDVDCASGYRTEVDQAVANIKVV